MDTDTDIIRIGCWIPDNKKKKIKFDRFSELCRQSGATIVELDLTRPLDAQGPFDVILHKISEDILVRDAVCNENEALDRIRNLQRYVLAHPDVPVLDDPSNIDQLKDRTTMFRLLTQYQNQRQDGEIFVPSFVEITNDSVDESCQLMAQAGVAFPCVCKPSFAGNSASAHNVSRPAKSHNMSLVFNARGLSDVTYPCVAQSFVNHNGVLHKLFVVGSRTFLAQRPSIKNLTAGEHETIHFKTNEVSKPNSQSHLNEGGENEDACSAPDADVMHEVGQAIRASLGINILGVDVIVERKTGRYGLIDVNPFPGFDGVSNIAEVMKDYVLEQAIRYRNQIKPSNIS